jgi:Flp pilus assembly protein TadB
MDYKSLCGAVYLGIVLLILTSILTIYLYMNNSSRNLNEGFNRNSIFMYIVFSIIALILAYIACYYNYVTIATLIVIFGNFVIVLIGEKLVLDKFFSPIY